MSFLPINKKDMSDRGWKQCDIIMISGDPYIDHPSFGTSIISRVLEDNGFKVGIISQPNYRKISDFKKLGKPKLFFSVSSGNVDSMVNNYTSFLNKRKKDLYSENGVPWERPDYSVITYSNIIHKIYPDVPIISGGIEASLRRFAEYDYLSNKVRQSILADAPIDLIIYGMGELQIIKIANMILKGCPISSIRNIDGTSWKMEVSEFNNIKNSLNKNENIILPSYSDVKESKVSFANAFKIIYENQNPFLGKKLFQAHPKTVIVQNKPMRPLSEKEMDYVYDLPYIRLPHPSYKNPIPCMELIRFSITTHRGCFGGCSFCSISQHQGKIISTRSEKSIMKEVKLLLKLKGFSGMINGFGGPSANMYGIKCNNWNIKGSCNDKSCLYPTICKNLNTDHSRLIRLLEDIKKIDGIKKIFIGYGVRYDLALSDEKYIEILCRDHIGGQLKIAPESFSDSVTKIMKKRSRDIFEVFESKFKYYSRKHNKNQYLVTFLMSGHPGCTLKDAIETSEYIRDKNRYTEQVQDFTPTPMTISTCMFYTGIDPITNNPIYIPRSK